MSPNDNNTKTNTNNNNSQSSPSMPVPVSPARPNVSSFENMPLISPMISYSSSRAQTPIDGAGEAPPVISDAMRQNLPIHDENLPIVKCIARARIPTTHGPEIFLHLYENNIDQKEHLAIVFGEDIRSKTLFAKRSGESQQDRMTRGAYVGKLYPGRHDADVDPKSEKQLHFNEIGDLIRESDTTYSSKHKEACLTRIHSECYTGETAWSARCDCGEQFDEAGRIMGSNGHGCIVYLRQEGRGIGLGEKLKAYNLQDLGADTVQANLILRHPADGRSFSLATAILLDLGLSDIKLLTNNPDKILAVEGKNREVKVIERVPMIPLSWRNKGDGIKSTEIEGYLSTKIERMGHLLEKPIKFTNKVEN